MYVMIIPLHSRHVHENSRGFRSAVQTLQYRCQMVAVLHVEWRLRVRDND